MKLIDANELMELLRLRKDTGIGTEIDEIKTVEAIPIDWIKKHIEASKHLTRQMTEYEFLQILLDDWYTYNKEKSL